MMDTYGDGNTYRGEVCRDAKTKTYQFTTDATPRLLPEEVGDYLVHRTRVTVVPKGQPIFSERATEIEIDDEAGGEYVRIKQAVDSLGPGEIIFDQDEWPVLRKVIDAMVARCRQEMADEQH